MLRIVLDTNTVLALWLFKDPGLASLESCLNKIECCCLMTREDALTELRLVLQYRQFSLSATQQSIFFEKYCCRCHIIESAAVPPGLPRCKDADDQKFLEIAAISTADILLSRDKALLKLAKNRYIRERFMICSPENFLKTYDFNCNSQAMRLFAR